MCTFYGIVMLRPRLKRELPSAAAALAGWKRLRPGESWPPITWELAVLVATCMARWSYGRHAVGCLLAFDCMLRGGELIGLRKSDVAVASDLRMGAEYRGMSLRLRHTKTGPNQWVEVLTPCGAAAAGGGAACGELESPASFVCFPSRVGVSAAVQASLCSSAPVVSLRAALSAAWWSYSLVAAWPRR